MKTVVMSVICKMNGAKNKQEFSYFITRCLGDNISNIKTETKP